MNIQTRVEQYRDEALATLKAKGYNVPHSCLITVEISGRLSRALGRAKRTTSEFGTFWTIQINKKAFTEDSIHLRETTLHEVAHIVDAHHHKHEMSHNAPWKRIMLALGLKPDVYASQEKVDSIGYTFTRRRETTHVFKCPCCGTRYKASQRFVNKTDPSKYYCTAKSCNKTKLVAVK